jgi:Cu-processing system permease protein
MIGVSMLSPVDLARILILLQMDVSAMLGYTGAVFKEFFGSGIGVVLASVFLVLWIAVPFSLSLRKFSRKDL